MLMFGRWRSWLNNAEEDFSDQQNKSLVNKQKIGMSKGAPCKRKKNRVQPELILVPVFDSGGRVATFSLRKRLI